MRTILYAISIFLLLTSTHGIMRASTRWQSIQLRASQEKEKTAEFKLWKNRMQELKKNYNIRALEDELNMVRNELQKDYYSTLEKEQLQKKKKLLDTYLKDREPAPYKELMEDVKWRLRDLLSPPS